MSALVRFAVLFAVVAAACGPGSPNAVTPTLPGDGDEHTASPSDEAADRSKEAPDPWAGRDDLFQTPPAKEPSAIELPEITRFRLANGLKVMVVEDHALPVASAQLVIKAGRREVPKGKTGLEQFAASMLTKGTKSKTDLEIAKAIDFVGGELTGSASYEATLVQCAALAKDLDTCLGLLSDVVVNPTFPEEPMEEVRKLLQAQVRQRRDDAGQLATAHFQNALWGEDHVRGWPMSMKTIGAITREDLTSWHRRWYKPNNAILAVSGDVDPRKLRGRLNRAFRTWRRGRVPKRAELDPKMPPGVTLRLVDKPGQSQSHIRVGALGIRHDDPTFYDTLVVNYVLGGGAFSSRLIKVLRSEEGKTYSASSHFDRNADRGAFVATTFTRSDETIATVEMLVEQIRALATEGPTEAEVRDAITNIAGSYSVQFESAADIAGAIMGAQLHGLDETYVRDFALEVGKVTVESAKKAADANLPTERFVVVIVGDARAVQPQLDAKGWKYEKVGFLEPIAEWERGEAEYAEQFTAAAAKKGKALLDKALAAKGGFQRLSKLKSLTLEARGKIEVQGRELPATLVRRYVIPGKLRLDIDLSVGGNTVKVITAIDGDEAWSQQPQQGVIELPKEAIVELEKQIWRDHDFILLRHRQDPKVKVARLPDETRDGTRLHVVALANPKLKTSVKLYLDPKTKLLHAVSYTEAGVEATETFSDYKKVSGISFAHSRRTVSVESTLEVEVDDIEVDATIDPEVFELPK